MKKETLTRYMTEDGTVFWDEASAAEYEARKDRIAQAKSLFAVNHPFQFGVGDIVRLHENGNLYAVCRRETIVVNVKNLDCGHTYWLGRIGDMDDDREQAYEYVYERDGGKPMKEQATLVMTSEQAAGLRSRIDSMTRVICGAGFEEIARAFLVEDA